MGQVSIGGFGTRPFMVSYGKEASAPDLPGQWTLLSERVLHSCPCPLVLWVGGKLWFQVLFEVKIFSSVYALAVRLAVLFCCL